MYSAAADAAAATAAASIVSYNTWSVILRRSLFSADPHSSVNENTRRERRRAREYNGRPRDLYEVSVIRDNQTK